MALIRKKVILVQQVINKPSVDFKSVASQIFCSLPQTPNILKQTYLKLLRAHVNTSIILYCDILMHHFLYEYIISQNILIEVKRDNSYHSIYPFLRLKVYCQILATQIL